MGTCLSKPTEEAMPESKYAVPDPAPGHEKAVAKVFENKDVVISAIPAVAPQDVVEGGGEDSAPVPAGAPPTELIGNLIDPISGEGCIYRFGPILLRISTPTQRAQAQLAACPTRCTTSGLLDRLARSASLLTSHS